MQPTWTSASRIEWLGITDGVTKKLYPLPAWIGNLTPTICASERGVQAPAAITKASALVVAGGGADARDPTAVDQEVDDLGALDDLDAHAPQRGGDAAR